MTKRIIISAMAAIATCVFSQPAWAEIGRVRSLVGEVKIIRDGRPITAASGVKLEQGDVISTGRNGRVGITFLDNSRAALGPGTEVALDEFTYDRARQTGSFVTRVNRGSLGVVSGNIARSRQDAMRVRTPTSTLGVRGTRFVVEVK
ncbi:FecR domain-containing protein [Tsuneonella sp. YG55]|uniref:FecR domain-containing protein n=1 Tax=Tsuneonella litorea TaxID=2976475 RepID=A0A9X3AMH4_9SPHN|nr:FecR domain-containing protein [Tsuneonella litorea]MCT2558437.1 FecR domain-containing protein [Tsuneonella litorea]